MKLFSARRLLIPLIPLYQLALAFRELWLLLGLEPVRRLRFPVVSIGNLSTGGAGKTPLTIALAKALKQNGLRVDVLSRGYGRKSQLAARVNPKGTAAKFGDEPLLIAREAGVPVYVAPRRYDAGVLAEADAAKTTGEEQAPIVHLLDDGFQHRQLARDVNILLLNSRDWQDWLLPAGNLREPFRAAQRATVLAIPKDEPELEAALRAWSWQGPVWRLRRVMETPAVEGPVAAFCGIARPEQFFAGLKAAGIEVARQFAFADHFAYPPEALKELLAEAGNAGAKALVTTEKDLVRLGKLTSAFPESLPLVVAKLHIEIEDQGAAIDWLLDRVAPAKPKPMRPEVTTFQKPQPSGSDGPLQAQ
jgi:tetraacyldisaccharide 4'-kinase